MTDVLTDGKFRDNHVMPLMFHRWSRGGKWHIMRAWKPPYADFSSICGCYGGKSENVVSAKRVPIGEVVCQRCETSRRLATDGWLHKGPWPGGREVGCEDGWRGPVAVAHQRERRRRFIEALVAGMMGSDHVADRILAKLRQHQAERLARALATRHLAGDEAS